MDLAKNPDQQSLAAEPTPTPSAFICQVSGMLHVYSTGRYANKLARNSKPGCILIRCDDSQLQ